MAKMNFRQAFRRVGIDTRGGRGTLWCELDSKGVMVLMIHKNYIKKYKIDGVEQLRYMDPGTAEPKTVASLQKSLDLLETYFEQDKPMILLEGEFKSDGSDVSPAEFDYATGRGYKAKIVDFDRATGRIGCHITQRFFLD